MDSIVLSKKDFIDLKKLIYTTSGINLHEGKLELLKSKIAKRMRLTQKSYKQYLSFLKSSDTEVIEFIDTVTTNHSFFFRENKCIEYIIQQFDAHPQKHTKEWKIWCAACSTGDEPYSVAAQLKSLGINFSILASDLSHTVLNIASRRIYKQDKVQKVPLQILNQYFKKGTDKLIGHIRVKKELADHIEFKKFNLISDPLPQISFDAILCRNVMIYFDMKTSEKVVNKLYHALRPNGFFAIGNAESLLNLNHPYKSIKKIPSLYIK